MQVAIVNPNQTSLDIVLMHCGTMEAAMEVMAANNSSITASIAVGNQYAIPDVVTTDTTALSYIQQNKVVIGTKG